MKTQEIPHDFRTFYDVFKQLEYKHDYITVFDDFLTAMMNGFTLPQYDGFGTSMFDKYTKDERLIFGRLIQEIIQLYDHKINREGLKWYDAFGAYYEMLASRSKKSRLGQYFTPEPVVDFMTMIQGDAEELTGKGQTVNDPACGSGRFLIAFHANFPGNYCYAEDIDPMCCKMTCINMMMHGCEGEVVQHNSLNPNDYVLGWKINPYIRTSGIPHIIPMEKEQSHIYQMWQNQKKQIEQVAEEKRIQEDQEIIRNVGKQMNLF